MTRTFRNTARRMRLLIVAVLPALAVFFSMHSGMSEGGDAFAPGGIPAKVTRVHDGDTVSVALGRKTERVRLIGIDAPELGQRPWGQRAKTRLRELLGDGNVTVVTDVEQRDRYNRLLAYLWSSGGTFINLEMVRQGYAVLYTIPPNVRYADRFRAAQTEARERKRGLWSEGGLEELPSEYRKKHPRR
jgi:micrococcal nuclease